MTEVKDLETLLFRFRGTNMLLAGPRPFSELETRFLFTHSFNMYLLSTSTVLEYKVIEKGEEAPAPQR